MSFWEWLFGCEHEWKQVPKSKDEFFCKKCRAEMSESWEGLSECHRYITEPNRYRGKK